MNCIDVEKCLTENFDHHINIKMVCPITYLYMLQEYENTLHKCSFVYDYNIRREGFHDKTLAINVRLKNADNFHYLIETAQLLGKIAVNNRNFSKAQIVFKMYDTNRIVYMEDLI